ncbi:MAG: acyltransferase [Bacteroidales bacterium]|nr:acyltransferase [Bacteroidales bacterium]
MVGSILFRYKDVAIRKLQDLSERRMLSSLAEAGVDIDGKGISFKGKCYLYISHGSRVFIGDGFICNSGRFAIDNGGHSVISVGDGATLSIGAHSGMSNTSIQCREEIVIGDYVNIGAGCLIMDSDFHSKDWMVRRDRVLDRQSADKASVHIGNDVFVGARSIICKGVTIGERAIIAAGSVVVNDIPADCLAGGNPARVIRSLR